MFQFLIGKVKTAIVQNLYEKHKIVTYPRTDSKYISSDIFSEIQNHFQAIAEIYPDLTQKVSDNLQKQKTFTCVNDKKISDHHAILPTKKSQIYQN